MELQVIADIQTNTTTQDHSVQKNIVYFTYLVFFLVVFINFSVIPFSISVSGFGIIRPVTCF